jgi:hypothetical protein
MGELVFSVLIPGMNMTLEQRKSYKLLNVKA